MNPLSKFSIAVKLPLAIVALTLAAVVATAYSAYVEARQEATEQAIARLNSFGKAKADLIQELFDSIAADIRVQAHSPMTVSAIREFHAAFEGLDGAPRQLARTYVDGNPNPAGARDRFEGPAQGTAYDTVHHAYHHSFKVLKDTMGYYDVFLMDLDGNVLYTVYKESDFGSNLKSGPLKDSGLAQAYRDALSRPEEGPPAFADFTRYAPSGNEPAAFVARPVFDETESLIGVLAYQFPVDAINRLVGDMEGLGQTGSIYMAGSDNLLRTDKKDQPGSAILATRVDNLAVSRALSGEQGFGEYDDHDGNRVMAHFEPVSFFGAIWALVVEDEVNELMASANDMRNQFMIIVAIAAVLAVAVSVLVARSITVPLSRVSTAMRHVSDGDYSVDVQATDRSDEIGRMARTLESFRDSLVEAQAVSREADFKSAGFQTSSSAMMMVDQDYNISFLNEAMEHLFEEKAADFKKITGGRGPRELIGLNMDMFHAAPEKVRQRLSRAESLPMEVVIKIGPTFFLLIIAAVRDKDGNQTGLVLEWKNQTKSLRDSTIIAALDANSVRIEVQQDGKLGWANSFVCRKTGRKVEDLLGMDAETILTLRPAKGEKPRSITEIIRSRATLNSEVILKLGKLEMRIDGTMTPMDDPQGKPAGLVLVGADVTEERNTIEAASAERERNEREQAQVVENLRDGLNRLSEGDLTARIDAEFAAQYEQLRNDFNAATRRLESVVGQIAVSATSIRSDTDSISSASQTLSKRTETQAATLEETAAALDQLTGSVRTAADGATNAAKLVRETRSNVETSGGVVHEAVDAMGEIEKFSNEISSISGVIDEIAFQTNLLALNAGVEAARAGEAGRGFAVVASEVRALAQRSSDAAREINSLISSSGTQIKRGVTLVSKAGEVLTQMLDSVSNISGSVESIAQSATEQSRGLQEINSAVSQLDRVTQQNAAMFEQTTAASLALAEEAEALNRSMSQFSIAQAETARAPSREGGALRAAG